MPRSLLLATRCPWPPCLRRRNISSLFHISGVIFSYYITRFIICRSARMHIQRHTLFETVDSSEVHVVSSWRKEFATAIKNASELPTRTCLGRKRLYHSCIVKKPSDICSSKLQCDQTANSLTVRREYSNGARYRNQNIVMYLRRNSLQLKAPKLLTAYKL